MPWVLFLFIFFNGNRFILFGFPFFISCPALVFPSFSFCPFHLNNFLNYLIVVLIASPLYVNEISLLISFHCSRVPFISFVFLPPSGLLLFLGDPWTSSLFRFLLIFGSPCLLHMVVLSGPICRLSPPPIFPSTPLLRLLQPLLLLHVSPSFSGQNLHSPRHPRGPYPSMSLLLVPVLVTVVVIDNFYLTLSPSVLIRSLVSYVFLFSFMCSYLSFFSYLAR